MLDCATAAFMKRRSRMVEVMAAVPTAAQAAWRMNWRRVRTEMFFSFMASFLNEVVRRTHDQMHHRAHAVPQLSLGWRAGVCEIGRDVVDDVRLCGGRELAGGQQRVQ